MKNAVIEAYITQSSFSKLEEGTIITGKVTEIREREVVIDIGAKAEGEIPVYEFIDIGEIQIGSDIEVFLEKLENKEGLPVISYEKAEQKKNWENILSQCEEGSIVSGFIKSKVKGGLFVNIGVDAFLPSSQIDIQPPKNLDQYLGQTYDFKILKINIERHNIVISRRELIEEQRQVKRRELLASAKSGDIRRGVVKNITDYGAFIDLDGLDGLLHITDMSWGRISHPNEMLKQGEEIDVMIVDVDSERERVSLGLKQTVKNPWDDIDSRYPLNMQVKGRVVNLVPYGAFIEIEDGVEGLVHVTEISWTKRTTKPNEAFQVGDEVSAVIIGIQKEEQKISLSVRQLEQNPWDMAKHNYPVGARVRGKIRNLTSYGAFVELEKGMDGMIHVSDLSWTKRIHHPNEVLNKDDDVEAIVLDVDIETQRIGLGIKQLDEDPWTKIGNLYKIGDIIETKVSKVVNYGVFVELDHGMEGLIHKSQIDHQDRSEDEKLKIKAGDICTARIIKVDKEERQISLSIKAAHYDDEQLKEELSSLDNDKKEDLMSLGDILDEASR